MILPIYLEPQPILHQKTQDISLEEIKSAQFQELVSNMVETMRHAEGIGLAAPQVGLAKRLTVVELKEVAGEVAIEGASDDKLVLINAQITRKSFKKSILEEGCLSIPGIYGTVKRPANITIEFIDLEGNKKKLKAEHLLARVIQHEVDHLEGTLFTEKILEYSNKNQVKPDYPHI